MHAHEHPYAYFLLKYRNDDREDERFIWNSRDGIVPSSTYMPDGTPIYLVSWMGNPYAPKHRPKLGDYAFVTLTEPLAEEYAAVRAGREFNADTPAGQRIREYFGDQDTYESFYLDGLASEVYREAAVVVQVTWQLATEYGWELEQPESPQPSDDPRWHWVNKGDHWIQEWKCCGALLEWQAGLQLPEPHACTKPEVLDVGF